MTPTEIAAVVAAVAVAFGVVGLLFAIGSLIATLRSARRTIDEVHRVAIPLLEDVHATVRRANADLGKVDTLLDRAHSISGTVDSASRLAFTVFSSPAVKALAVASGGAKALGRLRRSRRSGKSK